ncbi:hypothetical protein SD71_20520 [Cohnella kolymensis]|uniref:Regulatory protein YycH domain-containing protein n=1 Tax=Cohnella kolymensis TaxID=1590652 RepID=A0ABR5A140_9BACL|nr:hypothetical protein [Cohnella kolymensis]KIL34403.1 hypothetical protein SD71_20520 [Cohnella kolymensis]
MKRYYSSVILVLLIIVSIGTYYFYRSTDRLPEFKLVAVKGDQKEADGIELSGNYGARMRSEIVNVTTEGSEYSSRQSMYEQEIKNARSWFYQHSDMRKLVKEHRDFMRGKTDPDSFYMDKEWIIYAAVSQSPANIEKPETEIRVQVLNVKTGREDQFATIISEQTPYHNAQVVDVQRYDNELQILTSAMSGTEFSTKFRKYVLDLSNGHLIRNEELPYKFIDREGVRYSHNVISHEVSSAPGNYVLLAVREEKVTVDRNQSYSSQPIADHFFAYSYKTGKLIEIPESWTAASLNSHQQYNLNGNRLSVLTYGSANISVSGYDLDTLQEAYKRTSYTAAQLGAVSIGSAYMSGNRVIILLHQNDKPMMAVNDKPMIAVIDATKGALLYQGEVVVDGPASEAEEHMKHLRLYNLTPRI